jgi:thioredoxin reductase (NADPH)
MAELNELGRPVFVIVSKDSRTSTALTAAIDRHYQSDFDVETSTWQQGAALLRGLHQRGRAVALIITDLWPDAELGMELVTEARRSHPQARRALLVGAHDIRADGALQRAMTLGHVDGWLVQPWEPADQLLFPAMAQFVEEWYEEVVSSPPQAAAVQVVAKPQSARWRESQDLLVRNDIPHRLIAGDSVEAKRLLEQVGHPRSRLPIAVLVNGRVLVDPTNMEVAEELGAKTRPDPGTYDLAVVGGGPAGLSAAMYGASEGLRTAIIEREAFGGQAGTTSRIRNYLGFPRGVSGVHLARYARQQTVLFGGELIYGEMVELRSQDGQHELILSDGSSLAARAVIIATGVTYRRLQVPSVEGLVGAGVFYGSGLTEAPALAGESVVVVGGGNSAGQAVAHLARFARLVTLVVRGDSLEASMSDYLIQQLCELDNVEVLLRAQVVEATGSAHLEAVWLQSGDRERQEHEATALFVLIGTEPRTKWLASRAIVDEAGFVLTGRDLVPAGGEPLPPREPLGFETSVPGVFAVGDVRAGSVKRVASAVGEGSVVVTAVHQYLRQHSPKASSSRRTAYVASSAQATVGKEARCVRSERPRHCVPLQEHEPGPVVSHGPQIDGASHSSSRSLVAPTCS